jgi:hypothetical protein
MSKTFNIDNSKHIIMPNKCLLCGSSPHTEYRIYRSKLLDLSSFGFYTKVSYLKGYISVPVCLRHYLLMLLVRGLIYMFVVAMILFGILSIGSLMDYLYFPNSDISNKYIILFFATMVVFIILRKWLPIRLKAVGKDSRAIYIQNDRYADEFATINHL